MKHKNLLILCPSFPDNNNKFYWWIFVKEYINSIKKYFNKVIVISPVPFWFFLTNKETNCKNYYYDNVEVFFPRFFHLPIKYFRDKIWDNQYVVIDKLIKNRNIKFDIIHSHFIWPSWYVWVKLKVKYNKPLIVTWHWYDVYNLPFKNNFWKLKIQFVLKNADAIITVSKSNVKYLDKLWFWDNLTIIWNWNDKKKFFYIEDKIFLKKELWISNDKKIILTVWNLIEIKNHKTLILACWELLKNMDNFICYIIWDWVLKKKLQSLIDKSNLQSHVKLLWRKKHEEIVNYMNVSYVFVLPSISESFWVVQIEAMWCWIPVIGTINWGSEEIIINKDLGYLLKDNQDIVWMSNLINQSLNKEWDKEKIINYAINNFSSDKVSKKYLELYNVFMEKEEN